MIPRSSLNLQPTHPIVKFFMEITPKYFILVTNMFLHIEPPLLPTLTSFSIIAHAKEQIDQISPATILEYLSSVSSIELSRSLENIEGLSNGTICWLTIPTNINPRFRYRAPTKGSTIVYHYVELFTSLEKKEMCVET